jgi:predicted Zn-dependent protease
LAYGIEGARVLGMLRYSRLHENEADRDGLRLLQAMGVDPGEMIAFYRTLEANEPHQAESPSSLSTHPDTGDRIATLTRLAGPPPLHPVALLPGEDWKQIRSICEHRKASSAPEQRAAETH